ncbi:MAG: FkbM family methyltransferase [Planctomycetota bacterium]
MNLPKSPRLPDPPVVARAKWLRRTLGGLLGEGRARRVTPYLEVVMPGLTPTFCRKRDDGLFEYTTGGRRMLFPCEMMRTTHLAVGYAQWMRDKYRMADFAEVEPGDVVVDCGAFAGGFTLGVAEVAGTVHAVEPSPTNFAALEANTADLPNVHRYPIGFYKHDGQMQLNLSDSHVDDSLLTPDFLGTGRSVSVELLTLDRWAREQGIERIDFMKLEAEGVEIDILSAVETTPIRKFAVDCSAEREGESPREPIGAWLLERGYEVRLRGKMLFARRPD